MEQNETIVAIIIVIFIFILLIIVFANPITLIPPRTVQTEFLGRLGDHAAKELCDEIKVFNDKGYVGESKKFEALDKTFYDTMCVKS